MKSCRTISNLALIISTLLCLGGAKAQQAVIDFASQIQPVFSTSCAIEGCHTGETLPFGGYSGAGLILSEDNAYDQLFGAISKLDPDRFVRVEPEQPNNSLLILKLEGAAEAGARMPLGDQPLPDATIQIIRDWIAQGALRQPPKSRTAAEPMSWGTIKTTSGN